MAKQSGMGDQLFVDGIDLSGDVGQVQRIAASSAPLSVTAINASAEERILGLSDGAIEFQTFFNDAVGHEHLTLRAPSDTNRIVSYFHGSTLGKWAASLSAKQVNYDPSRGQDGSLTSAIQCLGAAYGLDHCEQLTAGKRTDTAATNGASFDSGIVGGTALGLAAYLHVFSFTGTSITVAIQETSDDAVGDPYAAVVGGAFVAATAVGAQRIQTAVIAVERYLRVVSTGTFNPCTFAVCATRSPVTP